MKKNKTQNTDELQSAIAAYEAGAAFILSDRRHMAFEISSKGNTKVIERYRGKAAEELRATLDKNGALTRFPHKEWYIVAMAIRKAANEDSAREPILATEHNSPLRAKFSIGNLPSPARVIHINHP